ncbi:STY4526/YPO1902 family pathogenicity island replication protein [Limnohabitans radicicola]|uniref:Uncharacterized protein n=1 Tax=Limnohabitans radicicola TaxID=2771427 RepID=A0A927FGR2_9BURK|nr:STY4526/YPO1902 family pathogenicity island replication protein [Limnohabitans radicicola]MBD8051134.1 hypothetical protein [Limnohabitans radicicola]
MSATPASRLNPTSKQAALPAAPDTHGRPHVVEIASPTIARAVVAELLLQPDLLSETVRKALTGMEGADRAMATALERMTVWVDLSGILIQGLSLEEKQWRQAALRYCVMRQAHFELLHELFKVSRAELALLRQDLGVVVKTRPKSIPDSAVLNIHAAWERINQKFTERAADLWIALADEFPQYGLNSLYKVIVKEGRDDRD